MNRSADGCLAVLSFVVGAFIMLIAGCIAYFSGRAYFVIVLVMSLILLSFFVMQTWRLLQPKLRYAITGGLFLLCLLAIPAVMLYDNYHNGIDRVDAEVRLWWDYDPFQEDTKAVSLDGPSSLRLEDDLPRLDGATALYPLYAAFARAVYPEGVYYFKESKVIDCSNTAGAYEKLLSGEADVIFAAGPSVQQLQMAKDAGVELTLTPIGLEAFVFFVNAENPVGGLTTEELRNIYSGRTVNWKEVGGKNARIRAFQRPENSGSQTALIGLMGDAPLMAPPKEDVINIMTGIIQEVSSYRNYQNAIGYSFLFFATEMAGDDKITLLSVDGVAPTRENVANRTYPYASEFFAVTAGTDNPNAGRLIEWILSEQGQSLVGKTGYTPLPGSPIRP